MKDGGQVFLRRDYKKIIYLFLFPTARQVSGTEDQMERIKRSLNFVSDGKRSIFSISVITMQLFISNDFKFRAKV